MDQKESNFESNSQASKDLVKSFTELFSVAKGLISATPDKNNKTEQVQLTNDHLKYLYPSIRSGTSRKWSSNTLKSLSSKKAKGPWNVKRCIFHRWSNGRWGSKTKWESVIMLEG